MALGSCPPLVVRGRFFAIGHRSHALKNPTFTPAAASLPSFALFALLVLHRLAEAVTFAVHLEDVAAMSEAIQ